MKQLELKHIAPYLPYGLQVIDLVAQSKFTLDLENISNVMNDSENLNTIRPILRPISDAKKQIQYADGCYAMTDDDSDLDLDDLSYNTILSYIERHFDIYGLIKQGLAIDYNTVKF